MLADVQAHFGFRRPLYGAGVFETEHQRTIVREVCSAVQTGRLVLLSGLVGSGKTHLPPPGSRCRAAWRWRRPG